MLSVVELGVGSRLMYIPKCTVVAAEINVIAKNIIVKKITWITFSHSLNT